MIGLTAIGLRARVVGLAARTEARAIAAEEEHEPLYVHSRAKA